MDKSLITERVRATAERIAEDGNLELVHVALAGMKSDLIVRIFIDKEGGVTIDDCSDFSRQIEAILDVEDFIPSRYVLEVSSPGIERELYSLADFVKFAGRLAKVKTKIAIDGQKTFVGPIAEVNEDRITIDDRTRGGVEIAYGDVDKANLKIDLAKEFGGR